MKFFKLISLSLFVGFFLACSSTKTAMDKTAPVVTEVKAEAEKVYNGINLNFMDKSVRPQDDFFRYVNGVWLDENEIPGDRGRWGSFDELRKKSSEDVLEVLTEAIENNTYAKGTDQFKAAAFYKTAMDVASINAAGIAPIQAYLDQIDRIKSVEDIQKYNEKTASFGNRGFFNFVVFPDLKNSSTHAAYLVSGSLGLPERDYYLKDDSKEIREKYVDHIVRMQKFIGIDEAEGRKKAEQILALETRMANTMLSKEESRNPTLLYNPRATTDLQSKISAVNWAQYFTGLGAPNTDTIIVMDVKAMESLNEILADTPIEVCKDYLRWNELNGIASFLSEDIEKANFDFYSTELSGVKEMRPRWEKVMGLASGVIGEPIGKLYVDKHFPPEAKDKALQMVEYVKLAFGNRIKNLEWMTDETKGKALDKLNSFTVKIGYPDKWKDYSTMDIKSKDDGGSFASNMLAASTWNYEEMISKIGKPVDKTEWNMSPQTVNAYYSPLNNEIVFPAAILQPPFYDYKADQAVNFGGIGAVIGHEISHGFDDQGSRFDASGNMTNWWSDTDREQFEARNQKLIDQFNAYEPLPGVFVNGEFTLGENIGDLGGINAAYDGLILFLSDHGRPGLIDGYSPEQRLFLSWATIWRTKMRDEEMKNRIKTDPHAPGMYRAIGPLGNLPAFYEAFDVKEGDKMYIPADKRVVIW